MRNVSARRKTIRAVSDQACGSYQKAESTQAVRRSLPRLFRGATA